MKKKYDSVLNSFLEVFKHFNTKFYTQLSRNDQRVLDNFIACFLFIVSQDDFVINPQHAAVLANINHLIANTVSLSSYRTTDATLARVISQDNNYSKILALYTARNKRVISFEQLMNMHSKLASIWWLNYQTAQPGTLTEQEHENVVLHCDCVPNNLELTDLRTAPMYFQSTYFATDRGKAVKQVINAGIAKQLSAIHISSIPRKGSIGVFTSRWQKTTAVYKSSFPQLEALSKKYDLTLIHNGSEEEQIDRSIFKAVKKVAMNQQHSRIDVSEIKANDFQLAYFPDTAMNDESVALANIRVAPIMVTGYGHPVSTFGSKMDYFIGGAESELLAHAEKNYTERLVTIPGIGAHPVDPQYTRKNPDKSNDFIINCAWTTTKTNWPILQVLKRIKNSARRHVRYQFFPSWTAARYNGAYYYLSRLQDLLGPDTVVFYNLQYQDYLTEVEKGSLAIDSYPFGGYNTVVDSLFTGVPILAIEGTQFYNRAASALLRKVNMGEVVTNSLFECENMAVELINSPEFLKQKTKQLDSVDSLRSTLVTTDEPQYFVRAIDYIIEHHGEGGRQPIIIQ